VIKISIFIFTVKNKENLSHLILIRMSFANHRKVIELSLEGLCDIGHNILSECDQVLQKSVFLFKICDKRMHATTTKSFYEWSVFCSSGKESDSVNDLCSSCFRLTYLQDTLQFICFNIDR
jgi:hypothetical protein